MHRMHRRHRRRPRGRRRRRRRRLRERVGGAVLGERVRRRRLLSPGEPKRSRGASSARLERPRVHERPRPPALEPGLGRGLRPREPPLDRPRADDRERGKKRAAIAAAAPSRCVFPPRGDERPEPERVVRVRVRDPHRGEPAHDRVRRRVAEEARHRAEAPLARVQEKVPLPPLVPGNAPRRRRFFERVDEIPPVVGEQRGDGVPSGPRERRQDAGRAAVLGRLGASRAQEQQRRAGRARRGGSRRRGRRRRRVRRRRARRRMRILLSFRAAKEQPRRLRGLRVRVKLVGSSRVRVHLRARAPALDAPARVRRAPPAELAPRLRPARRKKQRHLGE